MTALEHLKLDFMTAKEMDMYKKLCSNCLAESVLKGFEAKEKDVKAEIHALNFKIWNLFQELMQEDCLNSARPDQFLPMKNLLNIKLPAEGSSNSAAEDGNANQDESENEHDLNKQLREAF